MPCQHVRFADGTSAILCGGRQPVKKCRCGAKATKLCDWKTGNGKTCDAPLCASCSTAPAPEKDLCPEHAAQWEKMRPEWERRRRERANAEVPTL